jgi:hypothetical protein
MIDAVGPDCSARVSRAMSSALIAPSQARRLRYKGPNTVAKLEDVWELMIGVNQPACFSTAD